MGKEESYYKILGTTARIGDNRIKEKYIQAVKKHPPETDPEGFEKVREAYETLKDPDKRRQYDLMRKYGNQLEKIKDSAINAITMGNYSSAITFMDRLAVIGSDNPLVMIELMALATQMEDLEKLDEYYEKALELVLDEELDILIGIVLMKSRCLSGLDYYDEALETLEQAEKRFPELSYRISFAYGHVYLDMGEHEKAWEITSSAIPEPEDEKFENIHYLISWGSMLIFLDKWSFSSKVQTRFKKYIKHLTDEEEKEIVHDLLFEEYKKFEEVGNFRGAEFYIGLVKLLVGNKNEKLNKLHADVKKKAQLRKEIERLQKDDAAYPLLFLHTVKWFSEELLPGQDEYDMLMDSIPAHFIEELESQVDDYAAGIVYLSKKYPIIYKQYKDKWKNLFGELTAGLNREMRREIGRLRG